MTKAFTNIYELASEYRSRINTVLFISCLALVFIYALSIFDIISRTVALEKVHIALVARGSTIKDLDTQYLSITKEITPDILNAHGFKEGEASFYISRSTSLGRVALSGHEL